MKQPQSCCSAVTALADKGSGRIIESAFWHSFSRLTILSRWKASSSGKVLLPFFLAESTLESPPVACKFRPFICICICCELRALGVDTSLDVVALFHMIVEALAGRKRRLKMMTMKMKSRNEPLNLCQREISIFSDE